MMGLSVRVMTFASAVQSLTASRKLITDMAPNNIATLLVTLRQFSITINSVHHESDVTANETNWVGLNLWTDCKRGESSELQGV
jgi:hypothetical protein